MNSDNFKDKLNYLKATVDVDYLLDNLGFKPTKTSSREYRSSCKIHGGDNGTAFRFNNKTRTWVCFTHKCHEVFGNDIIGLIRSINECSFMDAMNYLENMAGGVADYSSKWAEFKHKKEVESFITDFTDVRYKPSIVSEECLRQFKPFRSDRFLKDGFLKETLDYFQIGGGYTDKEGYIRDLIPIYGTDSELVAYSLRDIRDDVSDRDDKYKLTFGFNKDNALYNLYRIKSLLKDKPAVIVEGFKSVWRLHEYGIDNAVAIMGSSVTEGQLNLLCTYAHKGCIIFLDNDDGGILGTINAVKVLSSKFNYVVPIFITEVDENGKGLDPSDLSKVQVYEYLNNLC